MEAGRPPLFDVVEHLQGLAMPSGTRIYGDTGTALQLTFYSGLPVQSVLPVRRAFFDTYAGEVLVVEGPATSPLTESEVRHWLAARGIDVSAAEARRLARAVADYALQAGLRSRGVHICSAVVPEPPWAAELTELMMAKTRRDVAAVIATTGNPMFKGFRIDSFTEMWQVFFYRFADPNLRMRNGLNYSGRVSGASATVLRGGWVVLHLPNGGTTAQCWRPGSPLSVPSETASP
jgi:hypothetical protein